MQCLQLHKKTCRFTEEYIFKNCMKKKFSACHRLQRYRLIYITESKFQLMSSVLIKRQIVTPTFQYLDRKSIISETSIRCSKNEICPQIFYTTLFLLLSLKGKVENIFWLKVTICSVPAKFLVLFIQPCKLTKQNVL